MTHLSRSDTDKMFSDMAERGSADEEDYGNSQYDDDEDFDMSGSGDDREYQCPLKYKQFLVSITFLTLVVKYYFFIILISNNMFRHLL